MRLAFDPFQPPATTPIGELRSRNRAAISGVITDLTVHHWAGGAPALHVTITDPTGSFTGAFLGRTHIAGVELGERIVLDGTVMHRRGRKLFMNPYLWLTARQCGAPVVRVDHEFVDA